MYHSYYITIGKPKFALMVCRKEREKKKKKI